MDKYERDSAASKDNEKARLAVIRGMVDEAISNPGALEEVPSEKPAEIQVQSSSPELKDLRTEIENQARPTSHLEQDIQKHAA